MAKHFPKIHKELLDIFVRLEAHYSDMCDTEFTIEQGKLWMLQTRVGKRTGAAALRMAVEMTKGTKNGKGGRKWSITREEAVSRVTAEHLDSVLHPQFGKQGQGARQGPRRVARRRRRARLLHRRRGRGGVQEGRGRDPRPQRDEPRGRARHDGVEGHPHRPRRARQPRRRGRPRLGHPGRRRRRCGQDHRQAVPGRRHGRQAGRLAVARRHHRRGDGRQARARRIQAARRVRDDPQVGRRDPQGQARCARQRRHRRGRSRTPGRWGPRASACAAPSTCSSLPTGSRSCAR